jgi:hypothetical protein
MIKYNLRQQNYKLKDKENNDSVVTLVWVILTIFSIYGTFNAVSTCIKIFEPSGIDPLAVLYENLGLIFQIFMLPGVLILYMAAKAALTVTFCHASPKSSVKLKLLENNGMPVCLCREAFKVWQTLVIYCAPVVSVYSLMLWLCVSTKGNGLYMVILFFMTFFMCYDVTLILYVLFYKIKDRMDYIAVDHHVYMFTLYHKNYIREIELEEKI